MLIPIKWVPYILIIFGILGTICLAIYGGADTGDTIFGIIYCLLSAISGAIWLAIKIKKGKR